MEVFEGADGRNCDDGTRSSQRGKADGEMSKVFSRGEALVDGKKRLHVQFPSVYIRT